MKPINGYAFNRKIAFLKPTDGENEIGEAIILYVADFTTYASIIPIRQNESDDADKTKADTSYKVTLRYRPDICVGRYIQYGDRVLRVAGVINIEEQNRLLELSCVEKVITVGSGV